MGETVNISSVAAKISGDIFRRFLWEIHQYEDENFDCVIEEHSKKTHPADVVFHYEDPYLGKRVYLHTDLKSYAADTITPSKLRSAFKSMCMAVDCAKESEEWRKRYTIDDDAHEIRGFLFVHNHDNGYEKPFYEAVSKINLRDLPLSANSQIHFFGPNDIQRLFSIANDIKSLIADEVISRDYTFFYPDLVMTRRQGDVWGQAATIETLVGPYAIMKYRGLGTRDGGYVIYYNSDATTAEEFEYFLDCLSRFQLLSSAENILIRVTNPDAPNDLKSIFSRAVRKYVKAWGFDPSRKEVLEAIEIERITAVANNYNPGDLGWRT